jgi:tetratricopeptide (TPR) repeat protein
LGVKKDFTKARELYEKAVAKGYSDATAILEELLIAEAVDAGRYAEALKLQETLTAKLEAEETRSKGAPGKETAYALNGVAWRALFARSFAKALTFASRAHSLVPDNLTIETNRAHALMFLGRSKEAEAVYLANKGKPAHGPGSEPWELVIASDFADLRKAGLSHSMMTEIEKRLGFSR